MSNSRSTILNAIGRSKPAPAGAPDIPDQMGRIDEDLIARFRQEVESAGGSFVEVQNRQEAGRLIRNRIAASCTWCDLEGIDLPGNLARTAPSRSDLEKLDLVLLEGSFGVAENGAVWIPGESLQMRILPFITRHLAVLLPKKRVVENLHIAYRQLREKGYTFGCFISGPSKTADIEQSLVMGAHGPEKFTLILIEEEDRSTL